MASGKTLNAANLEALGARHLAELLVEVSKGNATAQRRLRLALAGSAGAGEAARAVIRRLISIGGAKTWLNWQKIKPFLADMEAQRRAILDLVAPSDPAEAFELMWRLVACAGPVLARSDDGSGRLSAAFHEAARDLGPLAQRAKLGPEELAGRTCRVLSAEGHGAWDELVPILAPQLGTEGLGLLRDALLAWRVEAASAPGGGVRFRYQAQRVTRALQQIADALGDVDGYVGYFDQRARGMPAIAAGIARRLLDAGRPQEALTALQAVDARQRDQAADGWDQAHLDVLEALGRADEAQAFRWKRFLATLDAAHLRAYLKRLPDFEDFEAEERAMAHALAFRDVHQALAFLVAWPDLRRASELVLGRKQLLNGDLYDRLSPAADALDGRYPLAATLLRRAMIGFVLRKARASRYKHAAASLRECGSAAPRVEDFADVPDHRTYERALRTEHGRKAAFWHEVDRPSLSDSQRGESG